MSTEEMLSTALERALSGQRADFVLNYGLPAARDPMPAHATYWKADRDYLARTWRPSGRGMRGAAHPEGESVTAPPPALVCSARLP